MRVLCTPLEDPANPMRNRVALRLLQRILSPHSDGSLELLV